MASVTLLEASTSLLDTSNLLASWMAYMTITLAYSLETSPLTVAAASWLDLSSASISDKTPSNSALSPFTAVDMVSSLSFSSSFDYLSSWIESYSSAESMPLFTLERVVLKSMILKSLWANL